MIKKIIFVCLISFISNYSFAMFEETWEDITPNGKHIYYDEESNNGIKYLGDSVKICHVSKWYFYKGYTIGIHQKDSLGYTFFASDELKNKIYQFKNEQSLNRFLFQNNLNPIYIRWHYTFWSMFPILDSSLNGIWVFFLLIIIMALIAIIIVSSLIGNVIAYFLNEAETPISSFVNVLRILWKVIWKTIVFLLIPIFIINYLLSAFPQSF